MNSYASSRTPKQVRRAGVLLHITSLPGGNQIGDMGHGARDFADWLAACKIGVWQILPLGPVSSSGSPYTSCSSFAGNHLLISLDDLVEQGYLSQTDIASLPQSYSQHTSFAIAESLKRPFLEKAAKGLVETQRGLSVESFNQFCTHNNRVWLDDYSLFMALKTHFNSLPWWQWPKDLKYRVSKTLASAQKDLAPSIKRIKAVQFLFNEQWRRLKTYSNQKGVGFLGDVPIYVSLDSADVWAHPHLFDLTNTLGPKTVAGVPPDYFSPKGQLWGNPVYKWKNHKKDQFKWWRNRLKRALELTDQIRLDHFRGLSGFYRVPAGAADATVGNWSRAPGVQLLTHLSKDVNMASLVAEDLGTIDDNVHTLRKQFNLPGMAVLQFGFGGSSRSEHLPHNHVPNQVVYSGTHDNDTTSGWWSGLDENSKIHVRQYFELDENTHQVEWSIIRATLASPASTAVIPMQDYLGLGREARMNHPGVRPSGSNWTWRMPPCALGEHLTRKIRQLIRIYGRDNIG